MQTIKKTTNFTNLQKISIVKPRGFCAGVDRAIKIVEKALEMYPKPIYIKHQIVHNTHITQRFADLGAITIENISDIPNNSVVIFSAHGSPPQDFKQAKEKNITVIDAVCPLVLKVHLSVKNLDNKGHKIIYIGNKKHIEAKSVKAQNTSIISIIENEDDIKSLSNKLKNEKLACLTQTTLNVEKTEKIIEKLKEKFPNILLQNKSDICYATTNRQNALKQIEKQVDMLLIVGSKNSSNTNKLLQLAKKNQKPAYLIEDITQIEEGWFTINIKTVGISSGASVPDDLVQDIIKYFKEQNLQTKEIMNIEENMVFPLPKFPTLIKK